jgi:hypothetical protein
MAKRASEWIPHNILVAAEKAGLGLPLWYVGRNNGHAAHARKQTLADLADQSQAREDKEFGPRTNGNGHVHGNGGAAKAPAGDSTSGEG